MEHLVQFAISVDDEKNQTNNQKQCNETGC